MQHRNLYSYSSQRGSALLMALMLMTIAAIIATSIAFRQTISIKRTEQVLTTQQAYLYAQGVNHWAIGKLIANAKKFQENQISSSMSSTSQIIDPMPMKFEQDLDGVTIHGEIIDAQSFFNINTLGTQSAQQAFARLILAVDPDIDKDTAAQIVQATYQWTASLQQIQQQTMQQNQSAPTAANPASSMQSNMAAPAITPNSTNNPMDESTLSNNTNTNSTPAPGSAISTTSTINTIANSNASKTFKSWDSSYLQMKPPYRIPHKPMASASEFRLVHGVTRALYTAIAPYIIALPDTGSTINVNTAKAKVLLSTAQGLSATSADLLVQDRDQNPFPSLTAFESSPDLTNATVDATLLTVQSDFFIVKADIKMGDQHLVVYTLLMRTGVGAAQAAAATANASPSTTPSSGPTAPTMISSSSATTPSANMTQNNQLPIKVLTMWQSIGTL